MSYAHLTKEERSKIEILYQERYKINHIAQLIGRHRSTIYRELKRYSGNQYQAQDTQEVANQRACYKGRKPQHTTKLLEDIQNKLERTWSPEQIVGQDYQGKRFFKSIYIAGFIKES